MAGRPLPLPRPGRWHEWGQPGFTSRRPGDAPGTGLRGSLTPPRPGPLGGPVGGEGRGGTDRGRRCGRLGGRRWHRSPRPSVSRQAMTGQATRVGTDPRLLGELPTVMPRAAAPSAPAPISDDHHDGPDRHSGSLRTSSQRPGDCLDLPRPPITSFVGPRSQMGPDLLVGTRPFETFLASMTNTPEGPTAMWSMLARLRGM